jgi:UDP-N-acetylmuramoyl-L-alanyl-D-glutamate--2,6-diaminopimelate ligase
MIKSLLKKITPRFILNVYHLCWAFFSALFYGFPSRKLIVIGVTGTNGKSTTVDMINSILIEAGFKTASLSSLRFQINNKIWQNKLKMTMPGRFAIQRFLSQAKKSGCKYVVLETTSEGIKQYRHMFINYDIAVITNLQPEHIESHGSFANYKKAKEKLFAILSKTKVKRNIKKVFVVNMDDENTKDFVRFKADKKYGYGLGGSDLNVDVKLVARDIRFSFPKTYFSVNNREFNINFLGEFNIYNSLAAICVGLSQNIDLNIIKAVLEKMNGVPGRMEAVATDPFFVFVDFAHTPDALEAIHKAIKPLKGNHNITCVIGSCGGGRDKWKRPEMGKISARNCDNIILTNEDPYDEDPNEILDQIEKGIVSEGKKEYKKILDRKGAIQEAIKVVNAGDIILITGKGSEPLMCLADGRKIPWDDREIVKEELKIINKKYEN